MLCTVCYGVQPFVGMTIPSVLGYNTAGNLSRFLM